MTEILNHIFDASQIDTVGLLLYKQLCSLADIIDRIYLGFQSVLEERQIAVIQEGLAELPVIEGDQNLLQKAFNGRQ